MLKMEIGVHWKYLELLSLDGPWLNEIDFLK